MPKWKFNKKNSKTYRAVFGDESERAIWYDDHGNRVYGKDFGDDEITVQSSSIPSVSDSQLTNEQRLKKQRKYGIFFDDDYNYLQHLKSSKIADMEESSDDGDTEKDKDNDNDDNDDNDNFNREGEKKYGNENGENTVARVSQKNMNGDIDFEYVDYDSDYENAMNDDFDYENPDNVLEDDFVMLANQDQNCLNVERSEHLRFIDQEFQKFCEENYLSDDFEDYEEIDYSDAEIQKLKELTNEIVDKNKSVSISECESKDDEIRAKILDYVDGLTAKAEENYGNDEDDGNSAFECDSDDCQSLMSLHTNVSRPPQLLDDLANQTNNVKLPLSPSSPSSSSSLLSSSEPDLNKIVLQKIKQLSIRPKSETKQDKHARQKELKDLRRERRMLKKNSKLHFRDEKLTVLSKQLTDRKKGVKKLV